MSKVQVEWGGRYFNTFFINCQSNLIRIRIEEMNRFLFKSVHLYHYITRKE